MMSAAGKAVAVNGNGFAPRPFVVLTDHGYIFVFVLFVYIMMNTHSRVYCLVGEDQKARRHLGERPNFPYLHGQLVQGEA